MKKTASNITKVLVVLLACILTVGCIFGIVAAAAGNPAGHVTAAEGSQGRTFTSGAIADRLIPIKDLEQMPMTFEAVINVPSATKKSGTIFGNFSTGNIVCLNFEIYNNGSPALCFKSGAKTVDSVIFDSGDALAAMKFDKWVHLVITVAPTATDGTYTFTCYIDGVSVGSITKAALFDIAEIQATNKLSLGHNSNANGNFKGSIRSVALYNNTLSASEVKASYEGGVDAAADNVIAYYDMSDTTHKRNPWFELDESGNGYDLLRKDGDATIKTAGAGFDSTVVTDPYYVHSYLDAMPRTYSATVYVPNVDQPGTIFGNYNNGNGNISNFEIYKNGNVALVTRSYDNENKKVIKNSSIIFNAVDVRCERWINLTVVNETESGSSVYKLYVDGVLCQTVTSDAYVHDFDMSEAQSLTRKFSLGGAYKRYLGRIKDVAIYSDALDASEVSRIYKFGVDNNAKGLMAYYDLTNMAGEDYVEDMSGNGHHASRTDYTAVEGGRGFGVTDQALEVTKDYKDAPLTIEAEVYVPATVKQGGTIFGNYYARDVINFEIYTNGNPALYINEDGVIHSVRFNYDVRDKGWVHLAVVYDRSINGSGKYVLYANGEAITDYKNYVNGTLVEDNDAVAHVFELDMEMIQRAITFSVGSDPNKHFKGKIKNLALYSAPLSESEIMASYQNGVDVTSDAIMAYYDFDDPSSTESFVPDLTGNGYDLAYSFYSRNKKLDDYAYSFAFIGDTQFLVYKDAHDGTSYAASIYDWLIANRDKKNIKYVFGLGDVTDKNLTAEWQYALELHQKLGKYIPYAITPGNHDDYVNYTNYNDYFAAEPTLTDNIDGYYQEGRVENYYMNFEVGEHKYTVMVLQFGAPDAVLEWANGVAAANSDRRIIVLTHGYIDYSGHLLPDNDQHAPNASAGYNSGADIWEKFVSRHENIIISAAGHIDPHNIKMSVDTGVNGNTVYQFLIDNQALDEAVDYKSGMVAMFYFSEDGSEVQVEYISAYRSMQALTADPNAEDVLFREVNQFSFTIPVQKDSSGVVTEYGTIAPQYANASNFPFAVFNTDTREFIGGYTDLGSALAAAVAKNKNGNFTLLARRDSDDITPASLTALTGVITVDLAGYTVKSTASCNYMVDIFCNDSVGRTTGKMIFNNGSLVKTGGRGIMCLNYGTSFTADVKYSFEFNNVTFRSIDSTYTTSIVCHTWENGFASASAVMNVPMVFNGCTFDLAGSVEGAIMIPAYYTGAAASDRVVYSIEINGGELIADSADLSKLAILNSDANGRADSITYGKDADGRYMALVLSKGAAAPAESVNGGTLAFVKVGETNTTETYRLRLAELADLTFVPKTSITLYSELVYNVYIPVTDALLSFTLDGADYTDPSALSEKIVEIDGEKYYHLTVNLPAASAARDILLSVKLSVGEKTYTGRWNVSLLGYAERVMESEASWAECDLVKSVLRYVKAAYAYFGSSDSETVGKKIDAIIGSSDVDFVAPEDTTSSVLPGLAGATFVLDGCPRVRFYIANGYDVNAFTFTVGGRRVAYTIGTEEINADYLGKTYVDISLYAYMICDTLTYTVADESGSYHVASYLNYVNSDSYTCEDKAMLIALAEAFYTYCEAAGTYRNFVVGGNV